MVKVLFSVLLSMFVAGHVLADAGGVPHCSAANGCGIPGNNGNGNGNGNGNLLKAPEIDGAVLPQALAVVGGLLLVFRRKK